MFYSPTRLLVLVALSLLLEGCRGKPDEGAWCSAEAPPPRPAAQPVTYYQSIQPLVVSRCGGCHVQRGLGPFRLAEYEDFVPLSRTLLTTLRERHMPPWLAARCCTEYRHDLSLTEEELGLFERWLQDGMPAGERQGGPLPPPLGGLSRKDLVLTMPEGFVPQPPPGSLDEMRCFVLDWPLDRPMYVTGLNPVPGNRAIVHHLTIGSVPPAQVQPLLEREGKDGRPGFDCAGGLGSVGGFNPMGGSLVGGDFPDGLGTLVEPGSRIVLNVHYSLAYSPAAPDRTSVEFRSDPQARAAKTIVVANPAWLVGDAMRVPAGAKDVPFWFKFRPTLFTGGKVVYLRNVTPHMHVFGSKLTVRILRKDGSRQCLLEIPRWDFGWEQPFWFARPHELRPEDEVYLECRFDNTASRQPAGQAPRDIAWGESNQDMCVAFLAFTEEP
jgi:hypothetical protein